MHSSNEGVLVTLTADQSCYERICRYCQRYGDLSPHHISDPIRLPETLSFTTERVCLRDGRSVFAAILDFTSPNLEIGMIAKNMDKSTGITQVASSHDLAWRIGVLLAAERSFRHLPLLTISRAPNLDIILRCYGLLPVAHVLPTDNDVVWHRALAQLLAASSVIQRREGSASELEPEPIKLSPNAIKLRSYLWFDRERCILWEPNRIIPLTAQEARILAVLTRAARSFLSASELVRYLEGPGGYTLDKHSLEQTIHCLRRKLGESGRRPGVLINRRGLGYALVPEDR